MYKDVSHFDICFKPQKKLNFFTLFQTIKGIDLIFSFFELAMRNWAMGKVKTVTIKQS